VAYAKRCRFASLHWIPVAAGYAPAFPWEQLTSKIAQKADAAGITFTATKEIESENDEAEVE
jgi:hypothetical protein